MRACPPPPRPFTPYSLRRASTSGSPFTANHHGHCAAHNPKKRGETLLEKRDQGGLGRRPQKSKRRLKKRRGESLAQRRPTVLYQFRDSKEKNEIADGRTVGHIFPTETKRNPFIYKRENSAETNGNKMKMPTVRNTH